MQEDKPIGPTRAYCPKLEPTTMFRIPFAAALIICSAYAHDEPPAQAVKEPDLSIEQLLPEGEVELESGVELGKAEYRTSRSADSAIGPWRGFLWSRESGDPEAVVSGGNFRIAKLDLLHLIGTEYVYRRHKFTERKKGVSPTSQEFMLRFSVPGISAAK